MRSQDTQCIYALNPKLTKSELRKVAKINLRITAKRHAHLQTLTKTPAVSQNRLKLYEELRSQDLMTDIQTDGQTGTRGKQSLPTLWGGIIS